MNETQNTETTAEQPTLPPKQDPPKAQTKIETKIESKSPQKTKKHDAPARTLKDILADDGPLNLADCIAVLEDTNVGLSVLKDDVRPYAKRRLETRTILLRRVIESLKNIKNEV